MGPDQGKPCLRCGKLISPTEFECPHCDRGTWMGNEEKRWDPIKNLPAFASQMNVFALLIGSFLRPSTRPSQYLFFGLVGVVLGTWGLWRAKRQPEVGGGRCGEGWNLRRGLLRTPVAVLDLCPGV
jgi:hypothetical protein